LPARVFASIFLFLAFDKFTLYLPRDSSVLAFDKLAHLKVPDRVLGPDIVPADCKNGNMGDNTLWKFSQVS
jgi:hypothetical protein